MKIHSNNEWDKLKTCVVGSATGANFPKLDPIFAAHKKVTKWHDTQMIMGPISQTVIDEANEDLEALVDVLESFSVEVVRPQDRDFSLVTQGPHWCTDGYMNYCPRDVLLVIGDRVIECPMSLRARHDESSCYSNIQSLCTHWVSAPQPRLQIEELIVAQGRVILPETEPIFDAANILRLDRDILYLVSSSGNRQGAAWLQGILGSGYKVHVLEDLYASTHIDTTITVIRPGLVLLNGDRVNPNNCPSIFNGWDKIFVRDVVPGPFYHYPYGSKWMALNMLSVSPDTVICDAAQKDLIRELERYRVTAVPMTLRHARTLGGGFHCVTLDLERESA